MKDIVKGSNLMLFIEEKPIAYSTSHKLSINVETLDISSKDDGILWKNTARKKISWSLSSENLFIEHGEIPAGYEYECEYGFGDLYDIMIERKPIQIWFTEHNPVSSDEEPFDPVDVNTRPDDGWAADEMINHPYPDNGGFEGWVIITSLEVNAPDGEKASYTVQLEGVGELHHEI